MHECNTCHLSFPVDDLRECAGCGKDVCAYDSESGLCGHCRTMPIEPTVSRPVPKLRLVP